MPIWLIPSLVGGSGFVLGRILPSADSDSPIKDVTNLLLVGGTLFFAYRIFKKV
jgi:hypothetical protein